MIRGAREKRHYLSTLGMDKPIEPEEWVGKEPRKVLIVATKRVGDLIVLFPAIHTVRGFFPNAHIAIMASREHETLLKKQAFIDEFIALPEYDYDFYRVGKKYGLILSFRRWFPPPKDPHAFPPYFILTTDLFLGTPKLAHLHYLDTLKLLGISSWAKRPRLTVSNEARMYAKGLLRNFNFRPKDILVAVHPGSAYSKKRWFAERYALVLQWLMRCYSARFIIVQGKNEEDLVEEVTTNLPEDRFTVLSGVPLLEVSAVLARCNFFIGNDSGIMHLADAVGCPTVTIFGPSRAGVWGAAGPHTVNITSEEVWWSCPYCSGRHLKDKPCNNPHDQTCLQSIHVEDILGGIESLSAQIHLREHYRHLDSIKIARNILMSPFGSDGLLLANLQTMRPLFIVGGRSRTERCIEAVEKHGSYVKAVRNRKTDRDILDALLVYRIALPDAEKEQDLDAREREDRKRILSDPLVAQMSAYAANSENPSSKIEYTGAIAPAEPERCPRHRIRILLVNSIKHSIYGGGERWMVEVGRALQQRGHEMLCWGLPQHRWLIDAQRNASVCLNREIPLTLDFRGLPDLVSYLQRLKIDAVVMNLDSEAVSLGLPFRLAHIPVVLVRKGLPFIDIQPLTHWAYSEVIHGIITPSEGSRQEIVSGDWIEPSRVRVIPNGVEVDRFKIEMSRLDIIRKDLNIASHDNVILTVGRLVEQKGIAYLIDAIPAVLDRFPRVKVLIVGHGPQKKQLKKAVEKRNLTGVVAFLGERWDTAYLMNLADCFVLPSLYEGMSTAMLEAMAAGAPVVATSVQGATETITDGVTGMLVPPASCDELATAICTVLDAGGRDSAMTGKAYELVRNEYSFTRMIDMVEDVLAHGL
jgi:glycosyltransferase involved in cell wall biosynthesis/ADP-heptose:LPS heptosyltransferase